MSSHSPPKSTSGRCLSAQRGLRRHSASVCLFFFSRSITSLLYSLSSSISWSAPRYRCPESFLRNCPRQRMTSNEASAADINLTPGFRLRPVQLIFHSAPLISFPLHSYRIPIERFSSRFIERENKQHRRLNDLILN